jgi:hypothetical protein
MKTILTAVLCGLAVSASAAFLTPTIRVESNGVLKGTAHTVNYSNATRVSLVGGRATVHYTGGGAGGVASNAIASVDGTGSNTVFSTAAATDVAVLITPHIGDTNDALRISNTNPAAAPVVAVRPNTGRVGINTNNPQTALHVQGDATVVGSVVANGGSLHRFTNHAGAVELNLGTVLADNTVKLSLSVGSSAFSFVAVSNFVGLLDATGSKQFVLWQQDANLLLLSNVYSPNLFVANTITGAVVNVTTVNLGGNIVPLADNTSTIGTGSSDNLAHIYTEHATVYNMVNGANATFTGTLKADTRLQVGTNGTAGAVNVQGTIYANNVGSNSSVVSFLGRRSDGQVVETANPSAGAGFPISGGGWEVGLDANDTISFTHTAPNTVPLLVYSNGNAAVEGSLSVNTLYTGSLIVTNNTTNAAFASAITVPGNVVGQEFMITGGITGALTFLWTNPIPGASGSLSYSNDGTGRLISFASSAQIIKMSTNNFVGTNVQGVANKQGLIAYSVRRVNPVATNIYIWSVIEP